MLIKILTHLYMFLNFNFIFFRISKALQESRKYRHDTPGRDNNIRYTNMKSAIRMQSKSQLNLFQQ